MVTKYIYIHKVPYTYIQFRKKCTVRVFSNIELKCNTSFKMIPGNLWLKLNIFFLLKLIIKLFLFSTLFFMLYLIFLICTCSNGPAFTCVWPPPAWHYPQLTRPCAALKIPKGSSSNPAGYPSHSTAATPPATL